MFEALIGLVRDAPAGPVLRFVFGKAALPYPDEEPHFELPRASHPDLDHAALEAVTEDDTAPNGDEAGSHKEGQLVVDWYDERDPENPKNYSTAKKCFIHFEICFFTFTVYSSAAILTPAEQFFREQWGATEQTALLVLSMPLVGYAIGPLFFSPLSEMPAVGRNAPYLVSLSLFFCLTIAGATINDFPSLVVIRLLQGFLGSPVLATGAASAGDLFDLRKLPYALAAWGLFAFGGPGLTPAISAFAVQLSTWRWAMYETLILAGVCWVLLVFCFPETNPDTILLRRARRLRKLTGRSDIYSQSELKQSNIHFLSLVAKYLTTPFRITLLDPSVGFINLYTALLYSIFYTFFESFPFVFMDIHHFSIGLGGVAFLTLLVGSSIALCIYCMLVYSIYEPYTAANGVGVPEYRLFPGLFASTAAPIGVFIFAWTARPDINWIVPLIGSAILSGACAMLYMLIFLYLPLSYPRHAASLFAANAFLRSALTAGAVHFAVPLFKNLGIGRGNSLLGGLLVGCLLAFTALWRWGPILRAKSRFAEQY